MMTNKEVSILMLSKEDKYISQEDLREWQNQGAYQYSKLKELVDKNIVTKEDAMNLIREEANNRYNGKRAK